MSLARVIILVGKDLWLGPRSPMFVWALAMPMLITILIQAFFLTLIDPTPHLGIVDHGHSEIVGAVENLEGIALTRVESDAQLLQLVKDQDVDAGLVLAAGFDEAVRRGDRPELVFHLAGGSLLANRIVLGVTMLDLVREVEARAAPVVVELKAVGEREALPIEQLVVLLVVLFVLILSGIFVPAFTLVEEREQGTLDAALVTPVTITEILLAKALLGLAVAIPMGVLTLAMNGALGARPLALLSTLFVGAVICIEVGLIYGTLARDAKTLYTLVKTLNLILMGPVIFYFFPDWPQWIAKLFPTYWFIDPLYRVAMQGAELSEVRGDLVIGVGVALLLVAPVVVLGRRMQAQLSVG